MSVFKLFLGFSSLFWEKRCNFAADKILLRMKHYLFITAIAAFFLDVAPMPAPKSCGSNFEDDFEEPRPTVVEPEQTDSLQTTPTAQADF